MLSRLHCLALAATAMAAVQPAQAAVYLVNPAYPPGVNGTYTQTGTGQTGTYGVELRGGNTTLQGDWEIGVGSRTSVGGFFNQGQLNWGCGATGPTGCGTVFNFVLDWRPISVAQPNGALSISLTPSTGTNPPTTTVAMPVGQGAAPLVGNTLRIWAKRDATVTISEVDGRAFNLSGTGDQTGANGGPLPTSDFYFFSPDNWGGDGFFARGTVRIKGGNGSAREIFFTSGDFDPSAPYPEPDTWVLMIAGFGLVGAALRRQRRRNAPVAA